MENLYLIEGLGNPGADYSRTRHNAGFLVIEELARRCAASWTNEKKFRARLAQAECKGRRVCLCEPQTYMNASGEAVVGVARYYDVAVSRLLVIVDDADLRNARVALCLSVAQVIRNGLALLGVSAPESM